MNIQLGTNNISLLSGQCLRVLLLSQLLSVVFRFLLDRYSSKDQRQNSSDCVITNSMLGLNSRNIN